ncbi:MAG: hypothetical protein V1647_05095, partial [Pseudomonadota bacterium]
MRKLRIILSILLIFALAPSAGVAKKLSKRLLVKKQKKTVIEKSQEREPAIYNDIVGKPEKDQFLEGWESGEPGDQGAFSGDLGEMGGDIQGMMKDHNFTIGGVPHSIQGLPIAYTSKSTGFNLGAMVSMANLKHKHPYLYKFALRLWYSDRGARNHAVSLDIPYFFSKRWHIRMDYVYPVTIDQNYFGMTGNNAVYNKDFISPRSSSFISRTYYQYIMTYPSFAFDLEYNLISDLFSIYSGITIEEATVLAHDLNANSKLFTEQPNG